MEIVGVASQTSYLVKMTVDELGCLQGNLSSGTWEANGRYVGQKFDIGGAWKTIDSLRSRKDDLPRIANKLRALADLLQPIECEIPAAR